eukprot:2870344-Rhodomonas_salina.2
MRQRLHMLSFSFLAFMQSVCVMRISTDLYVSKTVTGEETPPVDTGSEEHRFLLCVYMLVSSFASLLAYNLYQCVLAIWRRRDDSREELRPTIGVCTAKFAVADEEAGGRE